MGKEKKGSIKGEKRKKGRGLRVVWKRGRVKGGAREKGERNGEG